uniref:Uncharacterized protein n=1 Tax=Cucumis melo TaxID=3656 RepID=A0A9I9CV11_CUCME
MDSGEGNGDRAHGGSYLPFFSLMVSKIKDLSRRTITALGMVLIPEVVPDA